MHPKQSDASASRQLPSQRERYLPAHNEANVDELDRRRDFNAAYLEDDQKFMRFLVPTSKVRPQLT